MAEDREAFRDLLDRIGQPYAPSAIVEGPTPTPATHRPTRRSPTIGLPGDHPARRSRSAARAAASSRPRPAYRERIRAGLRASPIEPGHGRALPRRLAGDRVRGHARRRRHVHRRVLDGERRPARRPHRRLDRRRAGPDADRRGPPAAPERGPGDHPGARRRGRLQRPVRALARLDRVRGHRGQPARLALVGARVEGDRLPDRPGRGPDRDRAAARGDPERDHGHDGRRLRAGARLRRGQAAALPVRQVPGRGPQPRQPDEGDRRGDGDRPDLRGGAEQGAPRASSRRAPGRSPRTRPGRPTLRLPRRGLRAGDAATADDADPLDRRGAARPARSTRFAQRSAAPIVLQPVPRAVRLAPVAGPRAAPPRRAAGGRSARRPGSRRGSSPRWGATSRSRRTSGRWAPRLARPRRRRAAPTLLATAKRAGFGDRDLAALAGVHEPARSAAPRPALGPAPGLRDGRHVRRGVRRRDAVLLLDLRRRRLARRRRRRSSGPPRSSSAAARSGSGRGSSSTTARSRPPTTLRATGLDRGDGQLQPGDRLDRLRRVDAPVLRAARRRERARASSTPRAGRVDAAARRCCRRSSRSAARRRSTSPRRSPRRACRCSAPTSRPSTRPRSGPASRRCSTASASRSPRAAWPTRSRRR